MRIIGHRGYHNFQTVPNSREALCRSFELGYGVETDFRDCCGEMVISHDIPINKADEAEFVIKMASIYKAPLAINVKSDGLKTLMKCLTDKYQNPEHFTFDMSVPQMVEYRNEGILFFTRQSEYEKDPVLYDDAAGVWIDAFEDDTWITAQLLEEHMKRGKKVCIVSPELHKKEHKRLWTLLKQCDSLGNSLMLCTDFPDEAKSYFLN